jgi:hypothetical protein
MQICSGCGLVAESDGRACGACGAAMVPAGQAYTATMAPAPMPQVPVARRADADVAPGGGARGTGPPVMYEAGRDGGYLDPATSEGYWDALSRHGVLVWWLWLLGAAAVCAVAASRGLSAGIGAAAGAGFPLLAGWFAVMSCVFWLRPLRTRVSEWRARAQGRAPDATAVYGHVCVTVQRQLGRDAALRMRRVRALPGRSGQVLEIRQECLRSTVSYLASGGSLFVGWTMWLRMSPARFLWLRAGRPAGIARAGSRAVFLAAQSDRARAFRDVTHGAAREAADLAAGRRR